MHSEYSSYVLSFGVSQGNHRDFFLPITTSLADGVCEGGLDL